MKLRIVSLALVFALVAPGLSLAGEEYNDMDSHPLRVVAYLVHPVGFGLEWLVFRPLHFVVSRPGLEKVFGHDSPREIDAKYEPIRY